MNKNVFIILALFALSITGLTSCSDDEDLGNLVVNVENEVGEDMTGKTVYLYKGEADYDDNVYLESKVTDNSGQVRFYDLEPDTYFLEADFEVLGIEYTAAGQVDVIAGAEVTVTLVP